MTQEYFKEDHQHDRKSYSTSEEDNTEDDTRQNEGTEWKLDKDLKEKLRENGLDVKVWEENLSKEGIKSLIQFNHADEKTKTELDKKITFGWEKNALAACFNSKDDDKKSGKKEKQLTETIKKVEERMTQLNAIINENERRKRIAISFNDDLSHKELHRNLTKWDLSGSEIAKRDQLTSLNLVRQISAGRIFRGTFLHNNMLKSLLPRRKLISIQQNDVDLMLPSTSEIYKSMEFFEQNQSQAFDHVIKHWGVSAAFGIGIGFAVFDFNIGFVHDQSTEVTGRNSELSAFTEIKDVVVVNTASFSLTDVKHSISDEAIDELKKIEKTQGDKNEAYLSFFNAFGSHYFTGTYTFGGIFNRSVQCRSKETVDQSETLKLVKDAIQTSASGMLESFAGSESSTYQNNTDENRGELKKEENYTVEKRLTMIGGPPEVDQISIWKLGLVESNRTWAIIDKDDVKGKWRGVWDLLADDTRNIFDNTEILQEELKGAWKEMREEDIKKKLR